jgi:NAD(P)-dependent dehydrogenase (short-subunit alcohol dehydrogenase family)
MAKKLDGKIALVTGGSSGIGLGIAKLFVEHGAHVYITGRRQPELDKAKAELGNGATAVQGDITNNADLDRLLEHIRSKHGKLDVVVANASLSERVPTEKVTAEHYDKLFDVNARGTFFTVQKALPLIPSGGSIVVISSIAQFKGMPGNAVYSGTKSAVRSFARTWAAELKDRRIRVNTLSPGPTETPMLERAAGGSKEAGVAMREMLTKMVPLGRIGQPAEIAAAVLFLASSDSSFVTGIDLVVDGGFSQL